MAVVLPSHHHLPQTPRGYTNRTPEFKPELRTHHDLETHTMNWGRSGSWITSTGVTVASTIYASVHLAAWNTYFPTTIENRMWHDSALAIVICSINIAIATPMDRLGEWVRDKKSPWHYWMEEHCSGSKKIFQRVIWVLYRILGLIFNWMFKEPIGLISPSLVLRNSAALS